MLESLTLNLSSLQSSLQPSTGVVWISSCQATYFFLTCYLGLWDLLRKGSIKTCYPLVRVDIMSNFELSFLKFSPKRTCRLLM
ncbi:hypothetical protein HanXRQr2_Chr11g0506591 [Helianthus annuus]|uniref:Uncharacterized protein n=1 Tax=Helianthus annuus TaxID=4232 RepID=A0A9K3HRD5_HELAN|nr:hypothetical protein HanXRQr2_Chr11g0506591 [Helianthus annuus]KAJ0876414.1 hypothetical protein HanPSC8_Chr11g0488151 [Helianthus annuus]